MRKRKINSMKLLLCTSVFLTMGCGLGNATHKKGEVVKENVSTEMQEKDTSIRFDKSINVTFFDSILRKDKLSIRQIQEHTRIDSMWYTGMFVNSVFVGDTILDFSYGLKGAIITFDDKRNCIYKFLLIFSTCNNINTDDKMISSDCDRDESTGYSALSYKILNDSMLETTERHFNGNSDSGTISVMKWKLDQKGKINSMTNE